MRLLDTSRADLLLEFPGRAAQNALLDQTLFKVSPGLGNMSRLSAT
ncbi:MAG: hypothetical protein JO288_05320 [Hyphomicrobiales bacterium]|nr:hypothetical protein [Hyphomicrobiales bacterium]